MRGNVSKMTRACGALRRSEWRNGFHRSSVANVAKKRSPSASVRPVPPTQIACTRSRALTTIR